MGKEGNFMEDVLFLAGQKLCTLGFVVQHGFLWWGTYKTTQLIFVKIERNKSLKTACFSVVRG